MTDRAAPVPAVEDGLDSAATAQKPQAVIDAIARAYGADYATVHRGVYERSANMTLAYEAARRKVAGFIGADPTRTYTMAEIMDLVKPLVPSSPRPLVPPSSRDNASIQSRAG